MLTLRNVIVEYVSGGYPVRPIDGLDLDARTGELVLLMGPSGCGKTTLLSCLAGILQPTSGSVSVDGAEVTRLRGGDLTEFRRRSVGIIFQAFNLLPSLSARANVALPMRAAGVGRAESSRRADELLDQVGLAERRDHRPSQLSGGQQQRVAIARALALDPPVILADEPTAHLDAAHVEIVLGMLRDLARPGRLVVVSTHDHRIEPLADQCVNLGPEVVQSVEEPGRIVELAAGDLLFSEGDASDLVYEVESGEIVLFRTEDGEETILRRARTGDYFGELGPMLGLPRSASARAHHRTRLLAQDLPSFRARRRLAAHRSPVDDGSEPAVPGEGGP